MDEVIEIGGVRVLRCGVEGPLLKAPGDANDFIGLAWSTEADLVAIPVERLGPDFLRLETRLAGEVLQKFVNYRLRCAIVGGIREAVEASRALRDFVHESNQGRAVRFAPDFESLCGWLKESAKD